VFVIFVIERACNLWFSTANSFNFVSFRFLVMLIQRKVRLLKFPHIQNLINLTFKTIDYLEKSIVIFNWAAFVSY